MNDSGTIAEGLRADDGCRQVRTRATCRHMIATLRLIFRRAGWTGVTSQSARRNVARRLADKGADGAQVGELLGLSSTRSVRRLLRHERRPLEALARDLV